MQHCLVRASAGTGKTYQLVQAYVRFIVEENLRPSDIVAITFTKKAAGELKKRIRDELKKLKIKDDILNELSAAPIGNFHTLSIALLNQKNLAILGDEYAAQTLFVEACEHAWFAGDEAMQQAVQTIAPHLSLDGSFPYDLWQAFNLARENGRLKEDLFGEYHPDKTALMLQQQLLEVRSRLSAATVKGKSLEKIQDFLQSPVPLLNDENWTNIWSYMGNKLNRTGDLGKFYTVEDKKLFDETIFAVESERCCQKILPSLKLICDQAFSTYQKFKQIHHQVDFTDLIEQAIELLKVNPTNFKAVLVDEAQDTNLLQRRFIEHLSKDASLFVVGDRKQSIYTFRGADPLSFDLFADDVLQKGGISKTLSISRRSTAGLVKTINHLGEQLFKDTYEALEPLNEDVTNSAVWIETDKPEDVALYVENQIAQGEKASDFALLLATMTEAPLYLKAFQHKNIQVITSGSGGFYNQPEVVDMLSLTASLTDPFDRLSLAIALSSPLIGFSDEALLLIFANQDLKLHEQKISIDFPNQQDNTIALWINDVWPIWHQAAHTLKPQELLRLLERDTQSRSVYSQFDQKEQRLLNLDTLDAKALEYKSCARFAFEMLQRREGDIKEMTAAASLENAVTLCSVHQSKGLQFKTVLLAGLNKKGRTDTSHFRYDNMLGFVIKPNTRGETLRFTQSKQLQRQKFQAEKARLLYVAVTRAEQRLVFFGDKQGTEGFAEFLTPWIPKALEDGVLTLQTLEASQTVAAEKIIPSPILQQVKPNHTQLRFSVSSFLPQTAGHPINRPTNLKNPYAALQGQLAHTVLASLDKFSQYPNAQDFIATYTKQATFPLDTIEQDLNYFLTSPLGQEIIQAQQKYFEMPFQLKIDHDILIFGQMDLVFWDKEKPVVVDYKLTSSEGKDVQTYSLQLQMYALALYKLLGDKALHEGAVHAKLVFLRDRKQPYALSFSIDMLDSLELKIATKRGQLDDMFHDLATKQLEEISPSAAG